ncbi:dehydrogenase [Planctomycetales bacterium]|nr:dehydrogenase [Planctomycetales bacterium]
MPHSTLQNKTALITGGARRLGRALTTALAANGCRVAIHYHRHQADAEALARELQAAGVDAAPFAADLSAPAGAENLFYQAQKKFGALNFLINNAAIYENTNFPALTAAAWSQTALINAQAPLFLARLFAEHAPTGAAIINLLDARMHGYDREHLAYHLAKRQLRDLTKILAWEFAPKIRVNALAPGLILPPDAVADGDEWLAARAASNPLRTHGTAAEIGAAAVFLLASNFITGEIIHIDGGRNLRDDFYR